MLSYFLKCRKNTEGKNPKVVRTKNGRIMLPFKCTVCNSKKSKLLKEQKSAGLLSNLAWAKIPFSSDIPMVNSLFQKYNINAIVNKFLLEGDKFMPRVHLKQPRFRCSACGPVLVVHWLKI